MKRLTLLLCSIFLVALIAGCVQRPEDVVDGDTVTLKAFTDQDASNSDGGHYRWKIGTDSALTQNVRYCPSSTGFPYNADDYSAGVNVSCTHTETNGLLSGTDWYSQLEYNQCNNPSCTSSGAWTVNGDSPLERWRLGNGDQFFHNSWGTFRTASSNAVRPDQFYRPYGEGSFINQRIDSGASTDSTSSSVVSYLNSVGPQPVFGRALTSDYQHPVYYRRSSDTGDDYYRINCTKYGGGCEIDDEVIQIPDGASGAGRNDGHLAVINQTTGVEHDLWQVNCNASGGSCQSGYDTASKELPAGGSSSGTAVTLNIGYGGKTDIDGTDKGRLSDGTAAHFGLAAGLIRKEELEAGSIEHALVITVPCTRNSYVWPANGLAATCDANGPSDGALIQFTGTDVDSYINNTGNPAWKRAIVRAGRDFGMYVIDTGGSHWYPHFESDESTRTFGLGEPIYTFGQSNFEDPSSTYSFPFGETPDEAFWNDLRVVDECDIPGAPC